MYKVPIFRAEKCIFIVYIGCATRVVMWIHKLTDIQKNVHQLLPE